MTRLAAALVLLGALAPFTTEARLLDSRANGMTVENTVVVPVDAATAWDGLVKHVDEWWPRDHSWFGKDSTFSITPKAGGCFCEIAGKRQAMHMTIGFVDPRKLLRMVGGLGPFQGMGLQGSLDWRFESVEGGTKITLLYIVGGYSATDLTQLAPVVDQVQALQLGGLGDWLRARAKQK